ncbi:MAG: HEPN domain-containing protein [Spirochaetia bacterium]|nr:HEPN domain-containing protein [Spirochaetia bacterium]
MACINLNQYYTETRYPDDILETYYEKIDAENSKESCEEIRKFIKNQI